MAATPAWVRRNRFAAWSGYFCTLITFATMAMALTAAGTGHTGWAMVAGGICAATILFGLTVLGTTVHRDHVQDHATPNLLSDCWESAPPWVAQRGGPEEAKQQRRS